MTGTWWSTPSVEDADERDDVDDDGKKERNAFDFSKLFF